MLPLPLNEKQNAKPLLRALHTKSEDLWIRRGERQALKLFRAMAERVPAYKKFLKQNKVRPESIKIIKDFRKLPAIDKDNYLRKYPLPELCWDGKFSSERWTIASTSGSTGEPFYFPRQKKQDWQYVLMAELYFLSNFSIDKKSTLYIDAFPLGPWIGGIFTYEAIRLVAEHGKYPLSIYTAGINKKEIIKAVRKFGPFFDQIIIGCYGPFLKDALDDGVREGLDWSVYPIKFVFSAEGFTEEFRDYVLKLVGKPDPFLSTLNHYGTVDLGTMSHETPLAILTRRLALADKNLYSAVFNNSQKLPTITQFLPEQFYFEEVQGGLYCSADSGLPLVRYNLKDNGGVFTLEQLKKLYTDNGYSLRTEVSKNKLDKTIWQLPFVYVYERNDFSISLYAFQIYPETIRRALQVSQFESQVTGKFTMQVIYDKAMNQGFEVNVELKSSVKATEKLNKDIVGVLTSALLLENSEFQKTHDEIGARIEPKIILWPYEDLTFFRPGTKQQWVIKNKIN
jgi:phenylacetate-CoA ligase